MNDEKNKNMDLAKLLESHRQERQKLRWEGNFREYFELVTQRAKLARLAHARISDMILSTGVEKLHEGTPDEVTRYGFFAKELFGIDESIERIVEYFKSAAQRLEVRKRILLLMGPVGGGKSTIVTLLKRGLEQFTRTEDGAVFSIKGCPMHEEPLHLIPAELRPEIERHYGIYIEGDLCPRCQYNLEHVYHGRHEDVLVERILFSEKERIGIGTFSPSDPKSQDITELTGSIDLSTIGEVGVESDPRAYRFDGELNISNRGIMEFIEMLKCCSAMTYVNTERGLLQIQEIAPPHPKHHQDFPFGIDLQTRYGVQRTSHIIYNGRSKTVCLRTRKGYVLEGAPDHRVLVLSQNGHHEWRQLNQLQESDRICISRQGSWPSSAPNVSEYYTQRGESRCSKPLNLPEALDEDLARLLGYFVAEGNYESIYGIAISNSAEEVIDDLRRIAGRLGLDPHPDGRGHYKFYSVRLFDFFQRLGLTGRRAHEKHVPQIIRRSPKHLMSAFLRAYFDGDGTVTHYITCTTASEKLAEQLQMILLNYGIIGKRQPIFNEKYQRYYYTIQIDSENIDLFNREIGFGIAYKREAAERLAAEARSAHRDVLPNMQAHWAEMQKQLQVTARTAQMVAGVPYRQRVGVRQMIGDMNYEQIWRFAQGVAAPSYRTVETIIEATRPYVAVPTPIEEALDTRFFYDEIEEISTGYGDLWDFCVPEGHTYVGNGFVNHNCDEKFLYSLLTLSQEQSIKTGRFAMIYADEVIVSHTNENEYNAFVSNKKNEALQDRIIMIKVPYNLKVSEEEKIYRKLLDQSEVPNAIHISPNTLKVAAMFAVLTRLEPSKRQNIDLVKKMKLYDGQEVDDFKAKDVRELRDEAEREGMDGISPRYIINRLSNALVRDGVTCLTPIDALRSIRDGFDQHTGISGEDREKYLNLVALVRKEYDDVAKNEVQRAFVYSFEEMARTLCEKYLDNVEAYCNKEKMKDPITEEELEPDEKLMRSIEEQIGISENAKNTFRQEILIRISSYARKGRAFDYRSHERLREAIEKKIFSDLKDVVKITTTAKAPDPDQLRRINEVIDRLVKEHGYCTVCANDLLNYVGTLLARA
jgi:predicted Ser/Thr protein kinase